MGQIPGDFALTMDELRVVARFAADSAETVLLDFEAELPDDPRPRLALAAALTFANGAPRTNLQRTTAFAAHRASKEATSETARLAAQACGDAAAAAYLHPITKATQVGHILRSAACAARVAELKAGGDEAAAMGAIISAAQRATPKLRDVLNRYPLGPSGTGRLAQIMSALDTYLRHSNSGPKPVFPN
ncbi:putative immunity protein [Rhodococcus sp. 1168]|uniref:putative immunity protein n=1 Tax=Rhodococcus sp. 1168 TaxID=2018041 RepID=UPI000A0CA91C|nr:exonuclease SbcC [Rhodococcus sp. 1168]ORI14807.1 exonuclease SbcC [Rhodococcus sp. 1168]